MSSACEPAVEARWTRLSLEKKIANKQWWCHHSDALAPLQSDYVMLVRLNVSFVEVYTSQQVGMTRSGDMQSISLENVKELKELQLLVALFLCKNDEV